MDSKSLIGVVGLAGSGKGTIAKYLRDKKNYREMAFADSPKYCLCNIFYWDFEMLKGETPESREWREKPDPYWSKRLGRPVIPREEMKKFATDVCRVHYFRSIWVESFIAKYRHQSEAGYKENIVVSDVRHLNEMKTLKELGGTLVYVEREVPEWLKDIKDLTVAEQDPKAIEDILDLNMLRLEEEKNLPHNSEWDWIKGKNLLDVCIKNTGTISDLENKISEEVLKEAYV